MVLSGVRYVKLIKVRFVHTYIIFPFTGN